MKGLVGLVILTVAGLFAALFYRLGAYKEVVIEEGTRAAIKTISKRHVGPYHKIVPVIEEVEKWVKENGEACKLSFGEFLDDPDVVDEDRLQSYGGCIVEKDFQNLPQGFETREWPARKYIVAKFEGAPSIGPMKVYPRAKAEVGKRGYAISGPIVEIYEIVPENKVKTEYLFPVEAKN